MKDTTTLDQRDLDGLKQKLANYRTGKGNHTSDVGASEALGTGRTLESPLNRTLGTRQLRWIHLPVNDLQLIRDLVTRLSHDSQRSEMHHHELMRVFNRSWTELAAGGRKSYMKPQCVRQNMDRTGQPSNDSRDSPSPIWNNECTALYMPYLKLGEFETTEGRIKTDNDVAFLETRQSMNQAPIGLDESITSRNSRQITQKPMTLDQYYYPTLTDTIDRDNDQVLSKYIDGEQKKVKNVGHPLDKAFAQRNKTMGNAVAMSGHGGVAQQGNKRVLVIDQLWIWIIDDKTIITTTTELEPPSHDQEERSSLLRSVLENIIYGDNRGRFERPESVDAVMELILGVATRFFMHKCVPIPKNAWKGPMEVFRESIRDVANEEINLFSKFLKDLNTEADERKRRGNSPQKSSLNRAMPANPYHIISAETELLDKIRDIRDELHMLKALAEDQENVWKQAFKTNELQERLQYNHVCTPTEVKKDLNDMILEAETTHNSITILLDLRQKQASIKEAEFARLQANGTARQSNTILVFTIITIVFPPLSFLSSLFALDVSAFPHESGDVKYRSSWLFPILIGVTAVVSIPAILLAWNVNAIQDWFKPPQGAKSDEGMASSSGDTQYINEVVLRARRRGSNIETGFGNF